MAVKKKTSSKEKKPAKKTSLKAEKSKVEKTPEKKAQKAAKPGVKKKARQKEPQNMDELLAQTDYQIRGLRRGDVLEGTITEKTRRALFIDIGAKTEGIVFDRELKEARELLAELDIGDKITVTVGNPENDSGQIVLSLRKAAADRAWGFFEEKLKTGESFEVLGREINKGGLIINSRGVQGFIPASQFSQSLVGRINTLINKKVRIKAIEVDREKNRLILSERAVSEAAMLAVQKEILAKVKAGQDFEAEVTAVMPFGFFVKISFEENKKKTFLEGLVHISEVSWERVDDLSKFGRVGDKIKVRVLAVDGKSGKLNLSMKRLTDDPWQGIEKRYPKDKGVKGKVSRITPFGIFISLEPGIEGLVHISKIPAGVTPKAGEELACFIDSLDPENRRMSLGVVLKKKPVGYK